MIAAKQNYGTATDEVLEWTAPEAIHRIRTGSITAERYASRLLDRYRETKVLKAITWIDENRVLEQARGVDAARSKGQLLGPLSGLPIVVMDMINTVGFPTTAGTNTLKGFYPPRDAAFADILFKNGAILLGKANMHELGRGVTTSNMAFGFTRNPYDTNRIPGGGAGGTAAAIAARITPAGLATDTAGSARMPGALCGVAGIRPSTGGRRKGWTLGSWAVTSVHDGVVPIAFDVTTPAPMGRTVADVALLDAVARGVAMPAALPLRGARIGVPRGFYWEDLNSEVARVSERALEKLRDAGAILVDVDLRQWAQAAITTFLTLATMNNLQDLARFLATNVPDVSLDQLVAGVQSKDVRATLQNQIANPVPAAKAEEALKMRRKLALDYEEAFRRYDVAALLYPTTPVLAPEIRPEGDGPKDTIELNGKRVPEFGTLLRNTNLAGVVGIPSLNIPAGLSSSGLPVGLALSGLMDGDSSLMALGMSVEGTLGRTPAPTLRATSDTQPGTPPAISGPSDSIDHILALLKQSAYVNVHGGFDLRDMDRSGGFTAKALLRRYDIDFRIDGCGPGLRGVNLLGEECGVASLKWTFAPNGASSGYAGATRNFTTDDLLVFDDESRNQLRCAGSGRMMPLPFGEAHFGVDAAGTIVEGTGVFARVQGSFVLTGSYDCGRLNAHFTMHLMDPGGIYQTESELRPLNGMQPADRLMTCLAFLGEPDPDHPVQTGPAGTTVHTLMRAVHTDFDRGRGSDRLRSTRTLGPVVARWCSEVSFNPAEAGPAGRPVPVRLQNIKITFSDEATGTLEANTTDCRGFKMSLPGVSGPLFRICGFGPIGPGTARFRNVKGMLSIIGATNLAPSALSDLYLLHLVDPDGSFRC